MTELVRAMGWPAGWRGDAQVLALIGSATLVLLMGGVAASSLLGISPILVQAGTWLLWLLWLGAVFPRNATQDASRPCELPYRRAFTREILIGVGVAFTQILRPAITGVIAGGQGLGHSPQMAAGAVLVAAGLGSTALGVSALGVARTLFVFEYVDGQRAVLSSGIYRFLRHPLFLGGTLMSLGLAVWTTDQTAITLGLINTLMVPFYIRLEDRRCCTVLGPAYADYRAAVGGMVPRRRVSISTSALRRQLSGSAGPTTERNRVSRL